MFRDERVYATRERVTDIIARSVIAQRRVVATTERMCLVVKIN